MKPNGEARETREFVLRNRYGMHVRPAGLFAKVASRFNAEVQVEKDQVRVVLTGQFEPGAALAGGNQADTGTLGEHLEKSMRSSVAPGSGAVYG